MTPSFLGILLAESLLWSVADLFARTVDGDLRELRTEGWVPLMRPADCPITGFTIGKARTLFATCAVNRDAWNTRVVRRDDTGGTAISRTYPTYDRDATVSTSLHLAGREGTLSLLDSKDRLHQVYRDPVRGYRLTVLAP